ncbi:RNA-directed DNA polymerase, eukaryota, reverse transcriptase zinc-binding domain protein, partial [Tanacetum coccineum]
AKLIKGICGPDGGIGGETLVSSNQSPWNVIVSWVSQLQGKGVDLLVACNRILGDGMSINFWDNLWCGDRPLKEGSKRCAESDNRDGWKWSLASNGFSVAYVRKYIVKHILHRGLTSTRWNRGVPIKVNIFMWRLSLDKLLTIVNMDRKRIDIDPLLCLVCGDHVENIDHLFSSCGMARDLWILLAR